MNCAVCTPPSAWDLQRNLSQMYHLLSHMLNGCQWFHTPINAAIGTGLKCMVWVTWEDASHNHLRVTTMKFQPPLQLLHTVYLIARVLVMQTPLLTISWCPASFLSSEKIRKIARSTCHGFHSISTSEDSCLWKYSTDSCVWCWLAHRLSTQNISFLLPAADSTRLKGVTGS